MNGSSAQQSNPSLPNGVYPKTIVPKTELDVSAISQGQPNGVHVKTDTPVHDQNGQADESRQDLIAQKISNGLQEAPPEIEHLSRSFFVPLSQVIDRSAQECWEGLSNMIEGLSSIAIPQQPQYIHGSSNNGLPNGIPTSTKQSQASQDKKEKLLNWANDQKAIFIKALVLLQWSQNAEAVHKVIDINKWLRDQGGNYFEAINQVARMKRELANLQVPNPDIKIATEILSGQRVSDLTSSVYIPRKSLSSRQILRTLKTLNNVLSTRLTLHEDLPAQLGDYRVHDGRVTFRIPNEFELDLSLLDEDPTSQFYFVDFRFTFSPSSEVPVGQIQNELQIAADDILQRDGLSKCYEFFHDFTLSYKLNTLYKQALDLAQGLWSETLRVEFIRRTLVVQYWVNRAGGKSWLEIGVKSSRRKENNGSHMTSVPFLHIRWMRHGKEVEQAGIEMHPTNVSMDHILRQVIACHTTHVLDAVYESLVSSPFYAGGDLSLEQRSSVYEPTDCYLDIQLSRSSSISISIEPATGALVLKPGSNLSSRMEHELNRAKNLAEILPQRILYLRTIVAEDALVRAAECAGWTVLRAFKPTLAESKHIFPPQVMRSVFMYPPHWKAGHMLAATYSNNGDQWSLIRQDQRNGLQVLSAQSIASRSMHLEPQISQDYLARLAHYTSGLVTLQNNKAQLTSMHITHKLPDMPRFRRRYKLPRLSFDFEPIKLQPMLQSEQSVIEWVGEPALFSASEISRQKAFIRKTIKVAVTTLSSSQSEAYIVASGSSAGSARVLEYLATAVIDPEISFNSKKRRFTIRMLCEIGDCLVAKLLQRLARLENIIACVSTVQTFPMLSITSLSMSHIAIAYHRGSITDLCLRVDFSSAEQALRVTLTPAGQNPHERVKLHLQRFLTDPSRTLSDNFRLLLPLLSITRPLLSLFQSRERQESTKEDNPAAVEELRKPLPRTHILPRSATMYGIQFYASPDTHLVTKSGSAKSPRMLARFEILPLHRKGRTQWILRPAIEEVETYSRISYCAQSLKDKITQEVFTTKSPDGWLPLDSGAACSIDEPEKLFDFVHGVVTTWLQENISEAGMAALNPPGPEQTSDGNGAKVTRQLQQLPPKERPIQSVPNGVQMNNQNRANNAATSRQPPKGRNVIELD